MWIDGQVRKGEPLWLLEQGDIWACHVDGSNWQTTQESHSVGPKVKSWLGHLLAVCVTLGKLANFPLSGVSFGTMKPNFQICHEAVRWYTEGHFLQMYGFPCLEWVWGQDRRCGQGGRMGMVGGSYGKEGRHWRGWRQVEGGGAGIIYLSIAVLLLPTCAGGHRKSPASLNPLLAWNLQ